MPFFLVRPWGEETPSHISEHANLREASRDLSVLRWEVNLERRCALVTPKLIDLMLSRTLEGAARCLRSPSPCYPRPPLQGKKAGSVARRMACDHPAHLSWLRRSDTRMPWDLSKLFQRAETPPSAYTHPRRAPEVD